MEHAPHNPRRTFWRAVALDSLAIVAGLALLVVGDDWVARGVALVNLAVFGASLVWLIARRPARSTS